MLSATFGRTYQTVVDILTHFLATMVNKPKLGVSASLHDQKTRFNEGGAGLRSLTQPWANHFDLIDVCPETSIGMQAPRLETRLVKEGGNLRLINPQTGQDLTHQMLEYAELQSDELSKAEICGFVFTKDSPTCGLENVPVYTNGESTPRRNGTGLFSLVFTTLNPHIPVIEEDRLSNPLEAEHFFARVEFFSLWLEESRGGWTADKILGFHNTNKLFLLSRSPDAKRRLGRLISTALARGDHPENIAFEYMSFAQQSLNEIAKPGPIAHAMERVLGGVSSKLSNKERQEMLAVIQDYRRGELPRSKPLTLLRRLVHRCGMENEAHLRFIAPSPLSLGLMANV